MSDCDVILDAMGLDCPLPLLKAKQALNAMQSGQRLRIFASDQGSVRDFQVFAQQSGHRLLESSTLAECHYSYLLQKI